VALELYSIQHVQIVVRYTVCRQEDLANQTY
jgi:hypothetical protein